MNHWKLSDDPHAEREASKYDNPVPSREYLFARLEEYGKPITPENLSRMLAVDDEERLEGVRRRLAAMERDGQILRNRRGAYALIDKLDLIRGRVQGHRDGMGFLIREDGKKPDLVLPPRQMRRVFDGDQVLVRISGRDRRGRDEATIAEVLARNTQSLVGVYRQNTAEFGVLIPENSRISQEVIVPHSASGGARDGQIVAVRITQQPATRVQPVGEVTEVLGERMDPGMEIDIAIRSYEIPAEFPPEVHAEIADMSASVAEADKQNRIDLRDVPLVTIDDESAKDFDDAVCAWKTKSGSWKLVVAIADVSHYVRPGSALDQEAITRGTSVYFPGQVVPMLPELLSNGLCSLNPEVDRLALVCEMNISPNGAISRYRFYEAVFQSHARLTYNKVAAILDDEGPEADALREQYRDLVPSLKNLKSLYTILREAREARGAIDFETTETEIIFNEARKIEKIVPRSRNDAHKIIEECMLAANVATARFLDKHDLPALYRIHEKPSPERLDKLRLFLNELGLSLGGGDDPTPQDYRDLAETIKGRPDADVIQTVMLRSMSRAVYSPQNDGHFGLAYPAYAHFTSPIRRYPDLLVHRAIRSVIRGPRQTNTVLRAEGAPVEPPSKWAPYTFEQMLELGEHCSMTERRADDATRDVEDWLKCEFMSDKLGEIFDGTIASVTQFGVFVRLDDVYVEGLVHVTSLPSDYYHYEAEKHRLKGERSGMSYRLGDGVTVQVARVDLDERKIDFELADDKPRPHRSNRGRKKPASGGASTQGKQGAGQDGNAAKKSRDGKPRRRSRRGKGDKRG
ncbi:MULTISPECIES: ribonuclease R [Chromohalobacter]|uniref:ribonuclease R n=1 Tax=Chromohalobacter TaxID=42054 RepID=UPI000553A8DB|nr:MULTISPECIES: ribonuclease R [Chromohalobacter]MBZ5875693.1 ribonuclease R [Chromohalobacter salexigens]MDF9433310.1 ribonuclease R [Chromohalobacter israelensis]MDO0944317.1 ribonuclease R [Chromohalobacter salexigens]NQY45896.1 ribonuclease R [Chromohalobacter sp.]PWW40140.1 RNAse R [Chromohalobacter salexigens]